MYLELQTLTLGTVFSHYSNYFVTYKLNVVFCHCTMQTNLPNPSYCATAQKPHELKKSHNAESFEMNPKAFKLFILFR